MSNNNIVTATFTDESGHAKAYGLWQWDYGQILRILGLALPDAVEVHFALQSTGGQAVRHTGITKDGMTEVEIPQQLLEVEEGREYCIYAFIYLSDETHGETVKRITMPVAARPKPEGYISTPQEHRTWEELGRRVTEVEKGAVETGKRVTRNEENITGLTKRTTEAENQLTETGERITEAEGQLTKSGEKIAELEESVQGIKNCILIPVPVPDARWYEVIKRSRENNGYANFYSDDSRYSARAYSKAMGGALSIYKQSRTESGINKTIHFLSLDGARGLKLNVGNLLGNDFTVTIKAKFTGNTHNDFAPLIFVGNQTDWISLCQQDQTTGKLELWSMGFDPSRDVPYEYVQNIFRGWDYWTMAVRDGHATIYKNGVAVAHGEVSQNYMTNGDVFINLNYWDNGNPVNISDIQFYTRELSPLEVAYIAQGGLET